MKEEPDVTWHGHSVSREQREQINGHLGCVVWFTGLSGCGKSTIANCVDHKLHQLGVHSCLLDGDNVRHGLNAGPGLLADVYGTPFGERFGLGFAEDDRAENIRRIGAVAQLFCATGIVTLVAFISPYRRDRDAVRKRVQEQGRDGDFIEVFVEAPLEVCEARDPKGLYQRARAGEISNFTGIDDPYEPPERSELVLDSVGKKPDQLADQVVSLLRERGRIESA